MRNQAQFSRSGSCSTRVFWYTWPSGKAGVCKTLIMGSIPIVASFYAYIYRLYLDFDLLRPIYGGHKKPVFRADCAQYSLYDESLCEKR